MKEKINTLEQTVIFTVPNIFTKEQCKIITDLILEYKEKNPNLYFNRNANNGCWMGEPLYDFAPELANFIESKMRMYCSLYFNSLPKPENITGPAPPKLYNEDWIMYSWANVNDPGSENREHTHSGNLVSGVMYFQSENTGRLEFMPYNYTYKMAHPAWPYYGVSYYEPKDGDIILFPSFLLHRTEKNLSDRQRVNMAFDGKLVPEHQLKCYTQLGTK